MSIKIMSDIWENSSHSGTELLLMLAIGDFSDDKGLAFPGITRLAKKCRVSKSSIQRAVKACIESKELQVVYNAGIETGHGKTNLYRINLIALRGVNLTPVSPVLPQGVSPVLPQGVSPVLPKPSVDPPVEPPDSDDSQKTNRSPVYITYEQEIGVLSPIIAQKVGEAIDTYPETWCIEAIEIAAKANTRRWNYIEGILKNWHTDGRGKRTSKAPNHKPEEQYQSMASEKL
jgi:DnaD/phage-associated family protein